ncbi:hypothetical protein ONE63_006214 [Megalurothrips usitatus]|uniref:C2H2-type domain-containing protein n=1 Tax=Megalurothrips usitatus TaxID=439358 RepID=A0AAV7XVX7_9NEOP|nr:hypothetical protein ONE63_006214 [Megalurothrips usitatus]
MLVAGELYRSSSGCDMGSRLFIASLSTPGPPLTPRYSSTGGKRESAAKREPNIVSVEHEPTTFKDKKGEEEEDGSMDIALEREESANFNIMGYIVEEQEKDRIDHSENKYWLDKWYGLQVSYKNKLLSRTGSATSSGPTSPQAREPTKQYECPKCGRSYMWKNTLMRHLRNECGKEPQFQCPFCPHRTKLKSNLTQHIRYKHMSPAP